MKILVFGRSGQVARALANGCWRGVDVTAVGRPEADIRDGESLRRALDAVRPDAVVNAAAYTGVDQAESEPEEAYAVNAAGAGRIAEACAAAGVPLVHLSTDYVFDGGKAGAYEPDDPRAPLGAYGAGKAAGEDAVRAAGPRHIVLRTSWVFDGQGRNFVRSMLRLGAERDRLRVVADQIGGPTPAADLARAAIAATQIAAANGAGWGVHHYCGAPAVSWRDFAVAIFEERRRLTGAPPPTIEAITTADYPTPARRPANSQLSCRSFTDAFGLPPADWRAALGPVVAQLLASPLSSPL